MIINKVESFVFKDYKAKAFVGKLNLFDNKSKIFPHEETQNENNITYSILKNHPIILGTKISGRNESIELEGNLIILDGHHRFEYILKNEVDEVFDVIFVDYEGGRIQRFRDGFTKLPSMSLLGKRYDSFPDEAKIFSKMVGNIIAYELGTLNIDLSFTPVLDLDYGKSKVISDRSFHRSHEVVSSLSLELIKGLDEMGFKNVAKHFPGHGFVEADSHIDLPIDNRKIDTNLADLKPYIKNNNKIDAVMTAHIIYKSVDPNPVCYSDYWINSILRENLNFKGLIISDDLLMKGANIGKSVQIRGTLQTFLQLVFISLVICSNFLSKFSVTDGCLCSLDLSSLLISFS